MARSSAAQLNIRSDFARQRVHQIVRETGMSATQVVEEALRAYAPPIAHEDLPKGIVRKGRLLVFVDGPSTTIDEIMSAIDAGREERMDSVQGIG